MKTYHWVVTHAFPAPGTQEAAFVPDPSGILHKAAFAFQNEDRAMTLKAVTL
jgi:hypothetical protein